MGNLVLGIRFSKRELNVLMLAIKKGYPMVPYDEVKTLISTSDKIKEAIKRLECLQSGEK